VPECLDRVSVPECDAAYGGGFESMRDALAGFLGSYPLYEKARLEQIA
jgi:hypothetical protein